MLHLCKSALYDAYTTCYIFTRLWRIVQARFRVRATKDRRSLVSCDIRGALMSMCVRVCMCVCLLSADVQGCVRSLKGAKLAVPDHCKASPWQCRSLHKQPLAMQITAQAASSNADHCKASLWQCRSLHKQPLAMQITAQAASSNAEHYKASLWQCRSLHKQPLAVQITAS